MLVEMTGWRRVVVGSLLALVLIWYLLLNLRGLQAIFGQFGHVWSIQRGDVSALQAFTGQMILQIGELSRLNWKWFWILATPGSFWEILI